MGREVHGRADLEAGATYLRISSQGSWLRAEGYARGNEA
jgi:hypothetical protein